MSTLSYITINGEGSYEVEIESEVGILRRLSNFLSGEGQNKSGIAKLEESLLSELNTYKNRTISIENALFEKDDYEERLEELKKRLEKIDEELGIKAE